MQRFDLDPLSAVGGMNFGSLQSGASLSSRALIEFQRERNDFLKRVAVNCGPSYAILDASTPLPKPQDFEAEARAARLAIENDQLRVERAVLLSQLAARDAEICDLRARMVSEAAGNEQDALPLRRPAGSIRVNSTRGAVRRGRPFIHPDDLVMEDE